MYLFLYYHFLTEVTFGFERTSYSNLEGREEEICVVVQSPGALSKQVVVTVTSTDISAEGKDLLLPSECMRNEGTVVGLSVCPCLKSLVVSLFVLQMTQLM